MKYLILTLIMLASLPANAQLTAEQQTQIEAIVKKQPPVTADTVERWAELGSKVGVGLASTAKELGVAASDFASTTTGKVITAVIVWHYIGGAIMHLFAGIMVFVFGFSAIMLAYDRTYPCEIEYSDSQKNIFGNRIINSKKRPPADDGFTGGILFCIALVIVAGLVTILTY